MRKNSGLLILPIIAIILLTPAFCRADVEVPLAFISVFEAGGTWIALLLAMLILVSLEAIIANAVLRTNYRESFWNVFQANIVSTACGIPIALIVVHLNLTAHWKLGYFASPWYYRLQDAFIISVLCFLLSVIIEREVMARLLKSALPSALWRWSWWANAASYAVVIIPMVFFISPEAKLPYTYHFDRYRVTVNDVAYLSKTNPCPPGRLPASLLPPLDYVAVHVTAKRIKPGGGAFGDRRIIKLLDTDGISRDPTCWDTDEESFNIYFRRPETDKFTLLFADGRRARVSLTH